MIKNHYMSLLTGEVVFSQKEAMELYRAGHDIAVYRWSEFLQKKVDCVHWEHKRKEKKKM